jgi:hypothetical protein
MRVNEPKKIGARSAAKLYIIFTVLHFLFQRQPRVAYSCVTVLRKSQDFE